ncbi:hypothetical protein [Parvularcula maris]|uniref:Uncharacterized protein n=1 Tax=Parvularcula maris TaxID=2965077 RepID=A0A9X2LBW0_9PROT|nr:hypothetical protein [Parvularcula maris]MCQ8186656.1 hypothetical protein [Parvularcula maris]
MMHLDGSSELNSLETLTYEEEPLPVFTRVFAVFCAVILVAIASCNGSVEVDDCSVEYTEYTNEDVLRDDIGKIVCVIGYVEYEDGVFRIFEENFYTIDDPVLPFFLCI